jgi:hypothetical protein
MRHRAISGEKLEKIENAVRRFHGQGWLFTHRPLLSAEPDGDKEATVFR